MSTLPRIPISRPDLGPLETQYVNEALANHWITQGEFVDRVEKLLCKITGRKFAICTSSGTTALIVSLLATKDRWRGSSHIAVPGLTFAAVYNAVELVGSNCYYLGSDQYDWQTPLSEWTEALHHARCFIAAPCYGHHGDLELVEKLAKDSETVLIEDCAESFLSYSSSGRMAGSYGDISCLSAYANKICTAGEGGACLTDDEDLAKAIREIINHGVTKNYARIQGMIGINGRLTDLAAAVWCAQIERHGEIMASRNRAMAAYRAAADNWKLPLDGQRHAPWLFVGTPRNLDAVKNTAEALNVETRPIFPTPLPRMWNVVVMPPKNNTWYIEKTGIGLPLFSGMTDEEIERVCTVIKSA